MRILGIDTGGTKSKAIVTDESYSLLGTGDAGPGNYRVAGRDGARENVEAAIRDALDDAGVDPTETLIGGFGMGSLDTEADHEIITGFLDGIDLVDEVYVENDVVVAYYSITAGEPGVVVVAGTGAMAYGQNASGEGARSSGWGWLFGDEGSGFDAARRGLQAATKAYDGRGEDTDLLDAAREHFELEDFAEDVFTEVYDEIEHAKDIAPFAEPVVAAAADGDAVAGRIVAEAGDELAGAAVAVVERLAIEPPARIGCVGGFGTSDPVAAEFESSVADALPAVEFVDPVENPVVGSVALVADRRGDPITREDLDRLDGEISALPSADR